MSDKGGEAVFSSEANKENGCTIPKKIYMVI